MKNLTEKLILSLLLILFLFLPFSSWLISLSGVPSIALVRDALILIILLLVGLNRFILRESGANREVSSQPASRRTRTILVGFGIAFVIWGALSYFWRDASSLQWLKGFRFTFMPIILFLCLTQINLNPKQKSIINIVFSGGLIIALISLLELFGLKIPLTTGYSGLGALESSSMVGGINIHRLQSVLAGPNALGLYCLVILAALCGVLSFKNRFLQWFFWIVFAAILILTFSRSAVIGLVVLIITLILISMGQRKGMIKSAIISLIILVVLAISAVLVYQSPATKDFVTHADSSSLRFTQYKRIWDSKYEIGLLGRGSGTAGPSSQNRLDIDENHWTENIYLDIFEELGLVGLILYLSLVGSLLIRGARTLESPIGKSAFLVLVTFSVCGIFLNYYVGQVGIFLLWLMQGLMMQEIKVKDLSK